MVTTTQLGIEELVEGGQTGAEVTVNEAIIALDAFVQLSVKDKDLNSPPGSPVEGDRYLVGTAGSGAWSGHNRQIALYRNGWVFFVPKEGWFTWVEDENNMLRYNGSAWVSVAVLSINQKSITILSPTSSENRVIFYTTVAITITQATAVVRGTSPSVTYQVKHDPSRAATGNNLFSSGQTVTNTTTGAVVTSFNDATIPAGSFVWLTTSATSGTNDEFHLTLNYTEDG